MIVRLRNPERQIEAPGPALVSVVLERLGIDREGVLVIRNGTIVPGDTRLEDDDEIEIRPVISGGAG
ncbi:MAG: sulfur carrier protein ThiS [Microthrixaceae bacterium]